MAEERKVEFAGSGTIKKCPNCGAQLEAFQARCPACGFAIGGAERGGSVALKKFLDAYTNEKDNAHKLEMIDTFPIPNTIEDTVEFALLAAQQLKSYSMSQKERSFTTIVKSPGLKNSWNMILKGNMGKKDNITDDDFIIAWKNKLEQVCQRAKIAYPKDRTSLEHLDMIVEDAENAVKDLKEKRKKSKIIFYGGIIAIFILLYGIILPVMIKSDDKKEKTETQRLEKMFTEIRADIKEGNYNDAELKLLDFDVRYKGESWREKKEFLKKQLEEAKEKAGE